MDKQEAIRQMKQDSRGIWDEEHAKEVALAFGLKGVPIREFDGGFMFDGKDRDAVAVDELAIAIVKHLEMKPVEHSPFIGHGSSAGFITFENCKVLESL